MVTLQNQAIAPFSTDIEQVILDMNRTFNPLHKDFMLEYQVQAASNGYVILSIALPEGMIRVFTSMLESMSGFFRYMHIKAKSAKASVNACQPSELQRREKLKAEYREQVFSLFDDFRMKGHTITESIKLTNSALKRVSHPWATYDIVSSTLRSSGRLRKDFRPQANRPTGERP